MTEEKKSEIKAGETTPPKPAPEASQLLKSVPPPPKVTAPEPLKAAPQAAAAASAEDMARATPSAASAATAVMEPPAELTKEEQAKEIMYKYMVQNAALGFLPIPVVDVITIGGTQLAMLNGIAKIYDIDYSQHMAKPIIASLLGALGYDFAIRGVAGTLVKLVPVVGLLVGVASMPIMGAASTYAVAKIFIQHFESGGTFINFDAKEAKQYFGRYFKEGIQVAVGMKDKILKPRTPAPAEK
jgi:uncharacterized protein (DUF697 family)